MMLLCIVDGVLPVFGAYITRDLLNEISLLIGAKLGSLAEEIFTTLRPIFFLFVLQFLYLFLRRILERVNDMVTAIAGELVVNHIKLKIIGKANEVDVSSFDRPEFYEKLENANREAGMRPIGILTATFHVISAVISVASFIAVLATLSPLAPIIVVICALPGAMVTYIYKNKNYRYLRRHSKERREMSYYSQLMVSKDYVKEIKILGLGNTFTEK
jgi:ABC-type multidrug transport system fused ATPase/permease subunit